jgi:hypothetical protein
VADYKNFQNKLRDDHETRVKYYRKDPADVTKEMKKYDNKAKKELETMADALADWHKKRTGKEVESINIPTGQSNYYMDALDRDDGGKGDKGYWATNIEMGARAFEAYMEDKLRASGRRNDYLVCGTRPGSTGGGTKKGIAGLMEDMPYPQGEERENINKAFDKLLKVLNAEGTLQKAFKMILPEPTNLRKSFLEQNRNAYRVSHTVPISEVLYIPVNRLKMVYQTEEATNWDKVIENMNKMESGEALDPVVIGYDYDVHDGHHRIEASKKMGFTHIPCVVGGSNPLEVERAREQYQELWKSFVIIPKDKQVIILAKSIGAEYQDGVWKVSVPFDSKAFKSLAQLQKSGRIELKEL